MSELVRTSGKSDFYQRLLITVSAIALASLATNAVAADDTGRPTVWIELGGQLERIGGIGDRILAPFMTLAPTPDPYKFASPADAVKSPRYAVGEEAKITFTPGQTNWVFSAALRYGRSSGNKTAKHQTDPTHFSPCITPNNCVYVGVRYAPAQFARTFAKHAESHLVLDFMAGKDVGLGMFSNGSHAIVSAGVRYAQFQAKSDTKVYARPVIQHYNKYPSPGPSGFPYITGNRFNEYTQFAKSERNFHGLGPSISWEATTPLGGDPDTSMLAIDWGVNAAILFGKQRAGIHHQTLATHYHGFFEYNHYSPAYQPRTNTTARSRSVTVPNVGGFAAASLQFPNAKVSLGYRADFFFGATDAGIDARKEDTLSFHGPFATISIGLGD